MSPRGGRAFREIWGTGEPSVMLTHPIKMHPLYLVWGVHIWVTENAIPKEKGQTKRTATSNPDKKPTDSTSVCHAGALLKANSLANEPASPGVGGWVPELDL